MNRIKIKNFGPIKEGYKDNNGWIDINKVLVFIGNQGSGKSTIAKLISTMFWIEKALSREEFDPSYFMNVDNFKFRLEFHRIEDYFSKDKDTLIEYEGESYNIKYKSEKVEIHKVKNSKYLMPRIMYVPAERNFIAYADNARTLKGISGSLVNFIDEYDIARKSYKEVDLIINDTSARYDQAENASYLSDKNKSYSIKLSDASSGFQSFVPMYLVSLNISRLIKNKNAQSNNMTSIDRERFRNEIKLINESELSDEQKRIAISELSKKFNESIFINIVEEPEQNLFPASQWQMLQSLLEFNNEISENQIIITTHSPYIINYLSILIQAGTVKSKLTGRKDLLNKLKNIVNLKSTLNKDQISIYQLDEEHGTVNKLADYEGIPSDQNYLNNSLRQGNKIFDSLLEIEEEL